MSVGLVLVSHSARLAEGVREVAAQMAPGVPIAAAGGNDDGAIGTSFEKVMAAVGSADCGAGAIVLYDIGSARMTAEMVLETLIDEQRDRVRLVDAPLVEGAIAAAVAAAGGLDLDAVVAAATAANGGPAGAAPVPRDAVHRTWILRNPLGLHARAAALLVRALTGLDADVRLGPRGGEGTDARSILGLVGLALSGGAEIEVAASGPDAMVALARIDALAALGFGELDEEQRGADGDARTT